MSSTCFSVRRLPLAILVLPLLLGASSRAAAQEPAKPEETKPAENQAAQAPDEKAKVEQAEKEGVVRTGEEVTVTGSGPRLSATTTDLPPAWRR